MPHTLPALWRAEKVQKKTAKAGFDWNDRLGALRKLEEEVRELREAVEAGQDPEVAEKLEADIRANFDKLMSNQSRIAAAKAAGKTAGKAVDVSADDFKDED